MLVLVLVLGVVLRLVLRLVLVLVLVLVLMLGGRAEEGECRVVETWRPAEAFPLLTTPVRMRTPHRPTHTITRTRARARPGRPEDQPR